MKSSSNNPKPSNTPINQEEKALRLKVSKMRNIDLGGGFRKVAITNGKTWWYEERYCELDMDSYDYIQQAMQRND